MPWIFIISMLFGGNEAQAMEARPGRGAVNGVEFPIRVLSGFSEENPLEKTLKKLYAGKRTVFKEVGLGGPLYLILDLRSPACPTCKEPSEESLDAIFKDAEAIQTFALPDGETFAVWTPAGRLMDVKPYARFVDERFRSLDQDLKDVIHATFDFNGTQVGLLDGSVALAPLQARARIDQDLRKAGYVPDSPLKEESLASAVPEINGAGRRIYRRDDAFLTVAFEPLEQGVTRLSIIESVSRPSKSPRESRASE